MIPSDLATWLAARADALDEGRSPADEVIPRLGDAGLLCIGVPAEAGGDGQPVTAAVTAIAAVAERSLSAAFMYWGQRAFIEFLVHSPNAGLRERWLPALLAGRHAGATGLSNAMKFLSGIEGLQVQARATTAGGWTLDGRVPWATNLRPAGFLVAVAVAAGEGGALMVAALPHDRAGLRRSADLDLVGLRGSHTAALDLTEVALAPDDLLHPEARQFLPRLRPAFLSMQCALSVGLARSALREAGRAADGARAVLQPAVQAAGQALDEAVQALQEGLAAGAFLTRPADLFRLRLRLADLVQQAVLLELQAAGGRGYHRDRALPVARHWREAAFIPVITPSVVQLQGELARAGA